MESQSTRNDKKNGRKSLGITFVIYQAFSGEDLQQFDEHASVPQVQVEVGDATADPGQDGVDPFREGLLLNRLTLI